MNALPTGLSPYHPALTLPTLIDSFGPLIFPLYKAALLRKRILLMHEAPVQLACNFVYNISILSNIPSSIVDLIPLEPLPTRLPPLFSVGVHDIDDLSQRFRVNDLEAQKGVRNVFFSPKPKAELEGFLSKFEPLSEIVNFSDKGTRA